MSVRTFGFALLAGGMAMGAAAQAPADLAQAQAIYNRAIDYCNTGNLPAPQREACVREAGAALDRARGGPATPVETTSSDGRAVIMSPGAGASQSTQAASAPVGDVRTSTDGRATIVVPADALSVPATR